MEQSSINPIKYVAIFLLLIAVLAGLFLLPLVPTRAQSQGGFANSIAGNTINSVGLGGNTTAKPSTSSAGSSTSIFGGLFGGKTSAAGEPVITVVNVEGQPEVYRIVNGLKHALPTTQIFYSYGYQLSTVQKISAQELAKFPTARLFTVEPAKGEDPAKNPTIYYLTEGGMLRPILNDAVFYSYGNRKEDVITINQKEFNYYPRNQYIYLERPKLDRQIYQITGGMKRYLTPVAVRRLDLKEKEIAPVNQFEFDAYPEGETVIF
jgi:hypothetical protein